MPDIHRDGYMDVIAAIDGAHDDIATSMHALSRAGDTEFGRAFTTFVAAVEMDFRSEEQVMEQVGYSALREHREAHARVLSALHHAQSQVDAGDFGAARKAIDLMPHWFSLHLETMDRALHQALAQGGSS